MASHLLSSSRHSRIAASTVLVAAGLLWQAAPVYAQLDPTLFLKRTQPNVLLMVDMGNRMLRDAPTNLADPYTTSNYYDPFLYPRTNSAAEGTLGVASGSNYRRLYKGFKPTPGAGGGSTTLITTTTDASATDYATFDARTRL